MWLSTNKSTFQSHRFQRSFNSVSMKIRFFFEIISKFYLNFFIYLQIYSLHSNSTWFCNLSKTIKLRNYSRLIKTSFDDVIMRVYRIFITWCFQIFTPYDVIKLTHVWNLLMWNYEKLFYIFQNIYWHQMLLLMEVVLFDIFKYSLPDQSLGNFSKRDYKLRISNLRNLNLLFQTSFSGKL